MLLTSSRYSVTKMSVSTQLRYNMYHHNNHHYYSTHQLQHNRYIFSSNNHASWSLRSLSHPTTTTTPFIRHQTAAVIRCHLSTTDKLPLQPSLLNPHHFNLPANQMYVQSCSIVSSVIPRQMRTATIASSSSATSLPPVAGGGSNITTTSSVVSSGRLAVAVEKSTTHTTNKDKQKNNNPLKDIDDNQTYVLIYRYVCDGLREAVSAAVCGSHRSSLFLGAIISNSLVVSTTATTRPRCTPTPSAQEQQQLSNIRICRSSRRTSVGHVEASTATETTTTLLRPDSTNKYVFAYNNNYFCNQCCYPVTKWTHRYHHH
eukprot:GHVS01061838.1.p1 GENE.GHVS01061838.1~~GHVS01061838.1.p1  ORF type:complete len:316 (+),score=84.07 GHVS01061838.1:450-1397(+)